MDPETRHAHHFLQFSDCPVQSEIKEVTQKLSFIDLLLYNLADWVVVIINRIRYMSMDNTLAHSEIDVQDSYDEPVSVATLCYTTRL